MLDVMERCVPLTTAAFREYRMGGAHLSESGLEVVCRLLKGEKVTREDVEMSRREWRELMAALDRPEEA